MDSEKKDVVEEKVTDASSAAEPTVATTQQEEASASASTKEEPSKVQDDEQKQPTAGSETADTSAPVDEPGSGPSEPATESAEEKVEPAEAGSTSALETSSGPSEPVAGSAVAEEKVESAEAGSTATVQETGSVEPASVDSGSAESKKEATPPVAAAESGSKEPSTENDAPKYESENDDDYDPENSFPMSPQKTESATNPQPETKSEEAAKPKPKLTADTVLHSVLSDIQKSSSNNKNAPQTNASLDLNKLLSSIGPVKSAAASAPAPSKGNDTYDEDEEDDGLMGLDHKRTDYDIFERPFTEAEQKLWEEFQSHEKEYVTNGTWETYPRSARMFAGNLPQDPRMTKPQMFKIFYKYGPLAQISLKNVFAFVQYQRPEDCRAAIQGERDIPLRGYKLHLEVSKAHQSKKEKEAKGTGKNNKRNRSRSPNRKDRKNKKARDRSPRRRKNAPELQIFVLEQVDRGFVLYVEKFFKDAGISVAVDDMHKNRAREATNQLAYDGVLGVVSIDAGSQSTGQINMQVFQRGTGGNVRFDEYLSITPNVGVELINRAKRQRFPNNNNNNNNQQRGRQQNQQSQPQQQQMPFPSMPQNNANLMGTLQNMDPGALQKMLGMLQQMPYTAAPPAGGMPGYQQPPPQQFYQMPQMPPAQPPPAAPQQQPQQQMPSSSQNDGQSTQQVQNIMEQLAKLQGQSGN